jgi:tetratricopeptide (TPR) repeat protein
LVVCFFVAVAACPAIARPRHVARKPSPCANGQALQRLGRLDGAQTAYLSELATPGGVRCATAGLARLGRLDESCANADALRKVGERQRAHGAYLQILTVDPSSRCATIGATDTASSTTFWQWLQGAVPNAGYVLGAFVLVVLAIAIMALFFLQFQTRSARFKRRWPAKQIRRPSLQVESFDDSGLGQHLGPATSGLVRGRVTWKRDRFGLNLVSGQAGIASALTGLGDISDETKAAVSVIKFLTALLPRRQFVLRGELQPKGTEGVGLSLELSKGGGAEALITFWSKSFGLDGTDVADAYQHLAVPAAAWVDIWMAKAIDGENLLTGDPQSWAFFRSGVDQQRIGDLDGARILYEQALSKDGENVGALANLGIIYRRKLQYELADQYLQRALKAISSLSELAGEKNPDWYRIRYQFAALYTNWATSTTNHEDREVRLARARREARSLALITIQELAAVRPRSKAAEEFVTETLKPFLEGTIEPSIIVLTASTAADELGPRPDDWPTKEVTIEAVRAEIARAGDDSSQPIDPWPLVAFVESGTNQPPAVRFNLACYYARTHDLVTASDWLLTAVRETPPQERLGLVDVAKKDPALDALRAKRPGIVPELEAMLEPPPKRDAAAQQQAERLIGDFELQSSVAKQLRSEGYEVTWTSVDSSFAMSATKDSRWILVEFASTQPLTDKAIEATIGALAKFAKRLDNSTDVSAFVMLHKDGDAKTVNLADANENGVYLKRLTEEGIKDVA